MNWWQIIGWTIELFVNTGFGCGFFETAVLSWNFGNGIGYFETTELSWNTVIDFRFFRPPSCLEMLELVVDTVFSWNTGNQLPTDLAQHPRKTVTVLGLSTTRTGTGSFNKLFWALMRVTMTVNWLYLSPTIAQYSLLLLPTLTEMPLITNDISGHCFASKLTSSFPAIVHGLAPGPVWMGAENLVPTWIGSPDRPAHGESLYWLSYPCLPYHSKR